MAVSCIVKLKAEDTKIHTIESAGCKHAALLIKVLNAGVFL